SHGISLNRRRLRRRPISPARINAAPATRIRVVSIPVCPSGPVEASSDAEGSVVARAPVVVPDPVEVRDAFPLVVARAPAAATPPRVDPVADPPALAAPPDPT